MTNRQSRFKIPRRKKFVLGLAVMVCVGLLLLNSIFNCRNWFCFPVGSSTPSEVSEDLTTPALPSTLPSVVITSLPVSGSEILGCLFYYNPDFRLLQVPSDIVKLEEDPIINPFVDACSWTQSHQSKYPALTKKIKKLRWGEEKDIFAGESNFLRHFMSKEISMPSLDNKDAEHLSNIKQRKLMAEKKHLDSKDDISFKVYDNLELLEHIKKFPDSQTVLHFKSGSWGLKLNWLEGILGDTLRSVYVTRDPRAWVANFLRNDMQLYTSMNVAQHLRSLSKASCQFKLSEGLSSETPHKALATLWEAYNQKVLNSLVRRHRVVRYEDLVRSPRSMANHIYQFIGFPLPPAMEHQFTQAAHSRVYLSPHEGVVHPATLDKWKKELTTTQITDIETICAGTMKELNYSPLEV